MRDRAELGASRETTPWQPTECRRLPARCLIAIAVLAAGLAGAAPPTQAVPAVAVDPAVGAVSDVAPAPSAPQRTLTAARPVAQITEVLPGLWVGGAVPPERMPGWPGAAVAAASDQAGEHAALPQRIFAVIDLRTAGEGRGLAEMRETAKAAGVGFVSIPVGRIGPPPAAAVEQLAAVLRNAEGAPVVLQCTSGNRAGDVLARYLIRTGVDVDSAIARGRSVGLRPDRAAAIRSAAFGHP